MIRWVRGGMQVVVGANGRVVNQHVLFSEGKAVKPAN